MPPCNPTTSLPSPSTPIIEALKSAQDATPVAEQFNKILNSSQSHASHEGSSFLGTSSLRLHPSGIRAFDDVAAVEVAEMVGQFPGLQKLTGYLSVERMLAPLAITLKLASSLDASGERNAITEGVIDKFSEKMQALSDDLNASSASGRPTGNVKGKNLQGRVHEVYQLAQDAFVAMGARKCFSELAGKKLYPEIVKQIAHVNGGNVDNIDDVVGMLDVTRVSDFMEMTERNFGRDLGLRTSLETFFKIPDYVQKPQEPRSNSRESPSTNDSSVVPRSRCGNYQHNTQTIHFDVGQLVKAVGDLLSPIVLKLADMLEAMTTLQRREARAFDSRSRDVGLEGESDLEGLQRREDRNDDNTGNSVEREHFGRSDLWARRQSSKATGAALAKDQSRHSRERLENSFLLPRPILDPHSQPSFFSTDDRFKGFSASSSDGVAEVSRPKASRLKDSLQNVGARSSDATKLRSNSKEVVDGGSLEYATRRPVSFQGVVLGSAGFSRDLMRKVDSEGRVVDTGREVNVSTGPTSPTASIDVLKLSGTDANNSGYGKVFRNPVYVNAQLGKPTGGAW